MSCKHPSLFQGMCVVCGVKVTQTTTTAVKTETGGDQNGWKTSLNVSGGKVLQLSAEEAASVSASKLNNLRSAKKLALVLDLDHTLLHAIQIEGQTPSRTVATARAIEGTVGIASGDGPDDNAVHHLPIEEMERLTIKHLVMKKRPFLDEFLEQANDFCQMTIYTAGTRRYAEAVARVIDPTRRYFGDRIVSRCDVANIRADGNEKSLERIYPGDASMAVVMDDREDVWRGPQSAHLLLVRPFVHFDPRPSEAAAAVAAAAGTPVVGDNAVSPLPDALGTITRAVGVSPGGNGGKLPDIASPIITLCAAPTGEPAGRITKVAKLYSFEHSSGDDQLRRCLQVLKQIHSQFYAPDPAAAVGEGEEGAGEFKGSDAVGAGVDGTSSTSSSASSSSSSNGAAVLTPRRSVATILTRLKKSVLAGCTVTFSGLIPTNEENPRDHTLWRLAESLGAQVSQQVLPRTTHLIALNTQTQKVSAVLQHRASEVWVLHPDWLIYCRWSLSRAQESTFMLNQLPPGAPLPNPPLDFSPLPQPQLQVQASVQTQTGGVSRLSSSSALDSSVGLGGSRANSGDNNSTSGNKKRAHVGEEVGGRSADIAAADSMMSAIKKLRAAGPAVGSARDSEGANNALSGAVKGRVLSSVVPSGLHPAGLSNGGLSKQPGGASDPSRRSALFPQDPRADAAPAGQDQVNSTTKSAVGAGGQMAPAQQIGVIKKKVGIPVLERDASVEGMSSWRRHRTGGQGGGDGLSRPDDSSSKGYVPGRVRVAGPGDIDNSFRLRDPTVESEEGAGLYFSDEGAESAHVGDSAASSSAAGPPRRSRERSNSLDSEFSARSELSGDGSSSSGGASRDSDGGLGDANSLLGDGDGDFALYGDDGDEGPAESDDSAADEGLLCCNDDQGSTFSATAHERGESWAGASRRRRKQQRAAHRGSSLDGSDADSGWASGEGLEDGQVGGRTELDKASNLKSTAGYVEALLRAPAPPSLPGPPQLPRNSSSSGSLVGGALPSSSDDDEGSDFEVMMMVRRRRQAANPGGTSLPAGVSAGATIDSPIVLDDVDAFREH